MSPRSARAASSSAWSATTRPAAAMSIARLQSRAADRASLVVDPSRPTTRKVRFVSEHFSTHLLRADWEQAGPVERRHRGRTDRTCAGRDAARRRGGAVGLRQGRADAARRRAQSSTAANARGKPVIVDPKAADYAIYRGATVITPNRKELADATRRDASRLTTSRRGGRRARRRSRQRRPCW